MRRSKRSIPLVVDPSGSGLGQQASVSAEGWYAQPDIRRFPPVLQFLTEAGALVEEELRAASLRAFNAQKSLEHICADVYHRARALGYAATIGIQEVHSSSMPSFPDETVWSVLLLIDLQQISSGRA